MKRITITMTIFLLSICINGIPMIAQQISTDEPSKFIERNLGGPRMGVTYRTWDKAELDQPKVISQFGGIVGIDAGRVAPTPRLLSVADWAVTPVTGLRFYMDTFVVRADVGFGKETMGLYFNFGHVF